MSDPSTTAAVSEITELRVQLDGAQASEATLEGDNSTLRADLAVTTAALSQSREQVANLKSALHKYTSIATKDAATATQGAFVVKPLSEELQAQLTCLAEREMIQRLQIMIAATSLVPASAAVVSSDVAFSERDASLCVVAYKPVLKKLPLPTAPTQPAPSAQQTPSTEHDEDAVTAVYADDADEVATQRSTSAAPTPAKRHGAPGTHLTASATRHSAQRSPSRRSSLSTEADAEFTSQTVAAAAAAHHLSPRDRSSSRPVVPVAMEVRSLLRDSELFANNATRVNAASLCIDLQRALVTTLGAQRVREQASLTEREREVDAAVEALRLEQSDARRVQAELDANRERLAVEKERTAHLDEQAADLRKALDEHSGEIAALQDQLLAARAVAATGSGHDLTTASTTRHRNGSPSTPHLARATGRGQAVAYFEMATQTTWATGGAADSPARTASSPDHLFTSTPRSRGPALEQLRQLLLQRPPVQSQQGQGEDWRHHVSSPVPVVETGPMQNAERAHHLAVIKQLSEALADTSQYCRRMESELEAAVAKVQHATREMPLTSEKWTQLRVEHAPLELLAPAQRLPATHADAAEGTADDSAIISAAVDRLSAVRRDLRASEAERLRERSPVLRGRTRADLVSPIRPARSSHDHSATTTVDMADAGDALDTVRRRLDLLTDALRRADNPRLRAGLQAEMAELHEALVPGTTRIASLEDIANRLEDYSTHNSPERLSAVRFEVARPAPGTGSPTPPPSRPPAVRDASPVPLKPRTATSPTASSPPRPAAATRPLLQHQYPRPQTTEPRGAPSPKAIVASSSPPARKASASPPRRPGGAVSTARQPPRASAASKRAGAAPNFYME
jgi:hypothetical protein